MGVSVTQLIAYGDVVHARGPVTPPRHVAAHYKRGVDPAYGSANDPRSTRVMLWSSFILIASLLFSAVNVSARPSSSEQDLLQDSVHLGSTTWENCCAYPSLHLEWNLKQSKLMSEQLMVRAAGLSESPTLTYIRIATSS